MSRAMRLHIRGFTLIEFMVAIALGLFVTTIVIRGFAATSAAAGTNSAQLSMAATPAA